MNNKLLLVITIMLLLFNCFILFKNLGFEADFVQQTTGKVSINIRRALVYIKYNDTEFEGVKIPDDVTVYFVSGVSNLGKKIGFDGKVVGYYYDNDIYILDSMTDDKKRRALRHEIAHYQYENLLKKWELEEIEKYYNRVCESETEFYAYTIDDLDVIDYEQGFNSYFNFHQRVGND